jgi:hypothetical protein
VVALETTSERIGSFNLWSEFSTGIGTGSFAPRLKSPKSFVQGVLRLVEFGDSFQVIQPGPGQVLLGLKGFKDNTDCELFSSLRQAQPFLGGD